MLSYKVILVAAILIVSAVECHKPSSDDDKDLHHHHHHDDHHQHHHDHKIMDDAKEYAKDQMGEAKEKVKEFAKNHMGEAKELASAGFVYMIKGFVFSAIAFIVRWSIYLVIAGGVIWYFATKRGTAGPSGGHQTPHPRSD